MLEKYNNIITNITIINIYKEYNKNIQNIQMFLIFSSNILILFFLSSYYYILITRRIHINYGRQTIQKLGHFVVIVNIYSLFK